MNDQKRILLAAALSFAVLIGWYVFFGEKQAPSPTTSPAQPPSSSAVTSPALPLPAETVVAKSDPVAEKTTEIETTLSQIQWTNRGARPARIFLKNFRESVSKTSPFISFLAMSGEKAPTLLC